MDSSRFCQPVAGLAFLADTWKNRYSNTLLGDLNWIRIRRWRSLIAELFDNEWSPFLKDIRSVVIEYVPDIPPVRGFLLACWLAAQLGWRYQGLRHSSFPSGLSFEGPRGIIRVDLKPKPAAPAGPYHVFGVRLETGAENPGFFSVERCEDPHCVKAQSEISGRPAFSRMVRIVRLETNELLDEGMKRLEPDEVWMKTLALAGTLLEKPQI